MPAFRYESILLHTRDSGAGWEIFGITHDRAKEFLAAISPGAGHLLARDIAGLAALQLAGLEEYDED